MQYLPIVSHLLLALLLLSSLFLTSAQATSSRDEELLQAAFNNDVDGVERALQQGANPNVQDAQTLQTPLMGAILRGHVPVVEYLLFKSSHINGVVVDATVPEKDGYTPAHGAGFQGRADIMRLLHKAGIDVVDDFHTDGFAPVHRACWGMEKRHTDTLQVLRDEVGVDLNMPAKNGRSCAEMTHNHHTRELLQEGTTKKEEL
jgi:ankyrin repeat protein